MNAVRKRRKSPSRKGHLNLRLGDFFKHVDADLVFLAVEPRGLAVEPPVSCFGLDAIDISDGSVCRASRSLLKVFQNVSFEPTGESIKAEDSDYGTILMTPKDIIIYTSLGFYYSVGGKRTKYAIPLSKLPVMRVKVGNPS